MADLTAISRLTWFPGIASASPRVTGGFRAWLGSGSFVPVATTTTATIDYFNEGELAGALAFDANSFALRAIETIDAIATNAEFPRASAWPAIKIYYAAFFSILFLMRLAGRGSVFLYGADTSSMKALWNAHGIPHDLRRGSQGIECDALAQKIDISRTPDGLGVHEAAWKEFLDYLFLLEASVPSLVASDEEKQEIVALLVGLRGALQRNNNHNGNWLSAVRNQINYHVENRLWFPYRGAERSATLLTALDKCDVSLDVAKFNISDDDDAFFAACSFIFGWAFTVMEDIARRSAGSRTLFSLGIHHYISLTSLRNLRQQAAA